LITTIGDHLDSSASAVQRFSDPEFHGFTDPRKTLYHVPCTMYVFSDDNLIVSWKI